MPDAQEEVAHQVCDYWSWPGHYQIVSGWWKAHKMGGVFMECLVPKLAIFVLLDGAPVAFVAADMSNSIGKATIEMGVTAPGQTAGQARRALQFAERALFSALKIHDYGFVQTFTSPAIARTLERDGWHRVGETVHLIKPIT